MKKNKTIQRIKYCYVALKKEFESMRTVNNLLGSSKLPKSCNYEPEEYSPLAYDKFEKESYPIMLKKTRK